MPGLFTTRLGSALILFILLAVCAACTRVKTLDNGALPVPAGAENGVQDRYWWYCRFKVAWPAESEPDMAVDLMLAHAVVRPALEQFQSVLPYWRFHRRAARDEAGHQFSFIFYSDAESAAALMEKLNNSPVLQQALSSKLLEQIFFNDPKTPMRPELKDASDANWTIEIQRNWPAYIKGVSATWLGLIDDKMRDAPAASDVRALLQQYRHAHEQITAIWKHQGQHAFFHHLNAIFGYEPLLIQKEISF